jgi:MFS family permease
LTERPTLGFNALNIGTWSIFVYIGSILGYYISGFASDKLGKKKTLYISVLIYFVGSVFFLVSWNISIIFMGLFFVNLAYAIYRLIAEIFAVAFFPTKLRASATGLVFLLASALGFVASFVMFLVLDLMGSWGTMFFIIGTGGLLALVLVTYLMPETEKHPEEDSYLSKVMEEITEAEIKNHRPIEAVASRMDEDSPPIPDPYLDGIETDQSIADLPLVEPAHVQSIEDKLITVTT